MIRETFKYELVEILERNTNLYCDDFSYENREVENGANFRMEYFYNTRYFFDIDIVNEKVERKTRMLGNDVATYDNVLMFKCNMSPGEVFDSYAKKVDSKETLHSLFESWSIRVEKDIRATSLQKKIDRVNKEFNNFKMSFDSDEYFTIKDAQNLVEKMKELEKKLTDHLTDDESEANDIEKLKADIELLNEAIFNDSKSEWTKKFHTRFSRWILNPQNQKILIDSATQVKSLMEHTDV